MKKLTSIIICIAIIIVALAACSSGPVTTSEYGRFDLPLTGGGRSRNQMAAVDSVPPPAAMVEEEWAWDYDMMAADAAPMYAVEPPLQPADGQVDWEDVAGQGQRHIIQTAHVELETEYFDDTVTKLRQLAPAVDGFVESEMLTGHGWRMLTIVMRVPVASFDTVMDQVKSLADIRYVSQRAQDVTDQFYDMIGSLEQRQVEEERILALIDEAQNINELLALEERLSSTRLSIEMYLSQLNNMAGQIAYSTISVTLFDIAEEEIEDTSPTLGERIGGAFGDSVDGTLSAVQNFIVFLAGVVIPLALLGLVGFAVYLVVRSVKRKRTT